MNEDEIQKLLDDASGFYNDGKYDEAVATWNLILASDQENERAQEGIKMVELLTADWDPTPDQPPEAAESDRPDEVPAPGPPGPPADPAVTARVQEAVNRVEELIAAGDLDAAREGVEALQQVAPDASAVIACTAKVECGGNPANYIEEQMAMARHYMILGETQQAGLACRKVLALDPDNAAAREILAPQEAGGEPKAPTGIAVSGDADEMDLTMYPIPATPTGVLDLSLDDPEADAGPGEALPLDLTEAAVAPAAAQAAAGASPDAVEETLDLALGDLEPPAAATAGSVPEASPEAKIQALLFEGDKLRDEGNLDDAIDAWSRIFVIQEIHADAEQRIDAARRVLEDQGRAMESDLYRGEDLLQEGRLEDARDAFQAVLDRRANHAEALARVEEIDRRLGGGEEAPAIPTAPAPEAPPKASSLPTPMIPAAAAPIATPPPAPPKRPAPPPLPVKGGGGPLRKVAIVVIVVGAVGAAGYFGWQQFFPSPPTPPTSTQEAGEVSQDPGTGVPPETSTVGDAAPDGVEPALPPSPQPEPRDPARSAARSQELLKAGIAAFNAGDFSGAETEFRAALAADAANFDAQDWVRKAEAEVAREGQFQGEVEGIRKMVNEQDYHNALYRLYRVETDDVDERAQLQAWIALCWYDWGVLLLKARNPRLAGEKLQEAVTALPDDSEAAAHLDVARRYRTRPVDASYEAYIARLSLRPLD